MLNRHIICFVHVDPRCEGGGLLRYVREELAFCAARGISGVVVFPFRVRKSRGLDAWTSRVWGVLRDGVWEGFHTPESLVGLVARWQRAGSALQEIQLHHVGEYRLGLVEKFLALVNAPVRLFLHDFHTFCMHPHLLREDGRYCGEEAPGEAKCAGCTHWNPERAEKMRRLLEGMKARLAVVAPSESTARIWGKAYPALAGLVRVVPHWVVTRTVTGATALSETGVRPLRVGYAGAIFVHKGWPEFLRFAEKMRGEEKGYVFWYLGTSSAAPAWMERVEVRAERTGNNAMVEGIRRAELDVLVLWAIWPETYSYVLWEAVQAGAMVITNPVSGNVAEVVAREGYGVVLRDEAALAAYFRDEEKVRADVAGFRGRSRPLEMKVNEALAAAWKEHGPVTVRGPGRVRQARAVEALYKIKKTLR